MDPLTLWVANAHAANPDVWELVPFVRHDQTDGVVVLGGRRLDPLDRVRAAAWLAAGTAKGAWLAALTAAAATGPEPRPPADFPTAVARGLDAVSRFAASPLCFKRLSEGTALWKPLA